MTDRAHDFNPGQTEDESSLTISLRKLSLPLGRTTAFELDDVVEHSALLVCRDNAATKWGPRWLRQAGLNTTLIADPDQALAIATSTSPDVIVVEAGLRAANGTPLFELLQRDDELKSPIIVLCNNAKEVQAALDARVFDVVRKPVEWQLVSRRAVQAAKTDSNRALLKEARTSLAGALALADDARKHLRSHSSFEPVTGLPNKSKFVDLLRRGMGASGKDGNVLAVFVIGFNRFRLVTEALGQESANLVLAEVGKRLEGGLHHANAIQEKMSGLRTAAAASINNGRFGLMLTCSGEIAELTGLQQRLTEDLARPVEVLGQTVYLSACVGAALSPQDADDADTLLQRAENAMRDAQSRGGGFSFYCAETDAAAARKLKIEHMLHEAFDRGGLKLAYQPLTDVASGRVVGAEALLRWQQSDKSYIAPSEFVPIAEESGLMIRIGEFVLDQACKQLKTWQQDGFGAFRMSVNVSRCQLMSGDFVGTVADTLTRYELDPACVDLELSERGVLSGSHEVISQLHELKNLGVKLSIDDFGTGDSAIGYLKELPIDVLKIDRSYINGLIEDGKDAAITSAMVALGKGLDLIVVAEGVETPEQLSILQQLGCDEYQGFHLSPAISSEKFKRLVHKNSQK